MGPRGTFSEEALVGYMKINEENLIPYQTMSEVIHAVDQNKVDKGIVPIENSIEGSVNETLDVLAFDVSLVIEKEIIAPVVHNLIGKEKIDFKDIKLVVSHPQATAQCRQYLAEKLPGVPMLAANSTAEAVKIVSTKEKSTVAIGTKLAAKIYGLEVIDTDIEDYKDNQTRFVVMGKTPSFSTGNDKTSIVCFIYENRPGSLLQILQEFAFRYINLTKIQSRPTKKALGDYCFFIDMEGHKDDEAISSVLKCLKCKLRDVKILGSYPKG